MTKITKASNKNMNAAKSSKNDEFYTRIQDIEKELNDYQKHFEGKTVYVNCDNPHDSRFFDYFAKRFGFMGLKRLICSGFDKDGKGLKAVYDGGAELDLPEKGIHYKVVEMGGNGDFRSKESIGLLKEADIVVGNPPFSLFREYVAQLVEYDKKFVILGNNNAITYKEVFPLIKENKMWLGTESNKTMEFRLPDDCERYSRIDEKGTKYGKVPAISWFTNLTHKKRNEIMLFHRNWNHDWARQQYKKYDNYDAINVDKVADIPENYDGVMGVPITFLSSYNPEQFEILNCNDYRVDDRVPIKSHGLIKDKEGSVDGVNKYARILIRFKK